MDWEEQRDQIPQAFSGPVKFKQVQNLLSDLNASEDARKVYPFLEECKKKVVSAVNANRESFSDVILENIVKVLQLELK